MNEMPKTLVLTRKNSPKVELYGLHGFPLTYFYPQDQ